MIDDQRRKLKEQFITSCKIKNYQIVPIKGDASFRSYDRISTSKKSYILMDAPPAKEDVKPFISVAEILRTLDLSVPEICNQDVENGFLLLEDFGESTIKNIMASPDEFDECPEETRIYERAIDVLIHLHKNTVNFDLPVYDDQLLIKESLIFIEWYISVLNGEKISRIHQEKFTTILKHLFEYLKHFPKVIVHRDFHAENLFWLNDRSGLNKIGLIDFQDAVLGCPVYDMVSLLEDARREVPESVVINSISRYLKAFPNYSRKDFMAAYAVISIQRNLKIIGIFTRQAAKNKNSYYLSMLPLVWRYIHNNLKHPLMLPLKNWLDEVLPSQSRNIVTHIGGEKILA